MNLALPLVLGGGLLLLASSKPKTASASSPTRPPGGATASSFQARIADALSRSDAAALMAIANEMQAAGLTAEADALRASAVTLQQLGGLPRPGQPGASPGQPTAPIVQPSPTLPNPPIAVTPAPPNVIMPPVVVPSTVPLPQGTTITPEAQKRLNVAQAMAMNLRNTSRYREDQNLVKAFQEQEGLKVDGKYGPKTATALATYGVVPPRPRYWSSKTVKADKQTYAAKMLAYAASDPTRAADWTAASKVQSDPAG